MQTVEARLISRSNGGRRAQVVVVMGNGAQKRSVTRHVRWEGSGWMGHNPNEAAVARLDEAEAELGRATERCNNIAALLDLTDEALGRHINTIRQKRQKWADCSNVPNLILALGEELLELDQLRVSALREELAEQLRRHEQDLEDMECCFQELRRLTPRQVQFVF